MNNHAASDQEFLNKLNELIENNLENEHYGVSEVADALGMSRSNLHRKLKPIVKISANQYIRQFRLHKGMEMLKQTGLSVSEVAYKVGFSSPAYFIKCFHDYYGHSPGEVGNRSTEDIEQISQIHFGKKKLIAVVSAVFVIIIIVVLLFVVVKPFSGQEKELEKIIAILPPINRSLDSTYSYRLDGTIDAVINYLSLVEDIEVKPWSSVIQYRNTVKPVTEIGNELNANYIVGASGIALKDSIYITASISETINGNQIGFNEFTVSKQEFIELPQYIAKNIANEIQAKFTPEEKELVEKKPTENTAAYDLYLKGMEFTRLTGNVIGFEKKINLSEQAKQFYERAIELDSTFSLAYSGLAHEYLVRNYAYMTAERIEKNLDSGLILANRALHFDNKNWRAYIARATYYAKKGNINKANQEYSKANRIINKKDILEEWRIYYKNFWHYYIVSDDFNALENFYKYSKTKPEDIINAFDFYYAVYTRFRNSGYPETAKEYLQKMLALGMDSSDYRFNIGNLEFISGNYKTVLTNALKRLESISDSSTIDLFLLYYAWRSYFYLRNFEKCLEYNTQIAELSSQDLDSVARSDVGYLYLKTGNDEKANYHFQKRIQQIQDDLKSSDSGTDNFDSHFDLTCIFSALNEKEKALKQLEFLKNRQMVNFEQINDLKDNPMLDNIRNEPEFIQILKDQENKFLTLHNKVGELIEKYE